MMTQKQMWAALMEHAKMLHRHIDQIAELEKAVLKEEKLPALTVFGRDPFEVLRCARCGAHMETAVSHDGLGGPTLSITPCSCSNPSDTEKT